MIVQYGTYVHEAAHVHYAISSRREYGQTGKSMVKVEDWIITGNVRATNAAALKTAEEDVYDAYQLSGLDLTIFYNDGTTESSNKIVSADTLNGVRPVSFRWTGGGPQGSMMQQVNRRTFQVHVRAEFLDDEDAYAISHWHQSFSILSTGGSDFVIQRALTGVTVKQTVATYTPYRAVQKGIAMGRITWPSFPTALFVSSLKPEPFRQEYLTPKIYGANQNMQFPIIWEYHFESTTSMSSTSILPP